MNHKWNRLWDPETELFWKAWNKDLYIKAFLERIKTEGDRLQEELETRTSLEVLERIGESKAQKNLDEIRRIIDTPNTTDTWAVVQIMNLLKMGLLEESQTFKQKAEKK